MYISKYVVTTQQTHPIEKYIHYPLNVNPQRKSTVNIRLSIQFQGNLVLKIFFNKACNIENHAKFHMLNIFVELLQAINK